MKRGFTNRYYTGGGSREAPALSRRRAILEDKKECRKFYDTLSILSFI